MAYNQNTFARPTLLEEPEDPPGRSEYSSLPASYFLNRDHCDSCNETGELVMCESCPRSFHPLCCTPPMVDMPDPTTSWFCSYCEGEDIEENGILGPLFRGLEPGSKEFKLPRDIRMEYQGELHRSLQKPKPKAVSCQTCGEKCKWKGDFATCHVCKGSFHLWCVDPPLLHAPLRAWCCPEHVQLGLSAFTHLVPQKSILLDFVAEDVSEKDSFNSKRKPKNAYRAVQLREQELFVGSVGDMQQSLLAEQNERALEAKVDRAQRGGSVDPVVESRLKEFKQMKRVRGLDDTSARELREYASRTNAVIRRAHEAGVPLKTPSFVIEDALAGRLPTLKELENATTQTLGEIDPLMIQFLAWQRLMELRKDKEEDENQDDAEVSAQIRAEQVARSEDSFAAQRIQSEIAKLSKLNQPKREILSDLLKRQEVAAAWAQGRRGLGSFLDATFAFAVENDEPLPESVDKVLGGRKRVERSSDKPSEGVESGSRSSKNSENREEEEEAEGSKKRVQKRTKRTGFRVAWNLDSNGNYGNDFVDVEAGKEMRVGGRKAPGVEIGIKFASSRKDSDQFYFVVKQDGTEKLLVKALGEKGIQNSRADRFTEDQGFVDLSENFLDNGKYPINCGDGFVYIE